MKGYIKVRTSDDVITVRGWCVGHRSDAAIYSGKHQARITRETIRDFERHLFDLMGCDEVEIDDQRIDN
jgi:hypothetical protein